MQPFLIKSLFAGSILDVAVRNLRPKIDWTSRTLACAFRRIARESLLAVANGAEAAVTRADSK
jgi:hypothetical protein